MISLCRIASQRKRGGAETLNMAHTYIRAFAKVERKDERVEYLISGFKDQTFKPEKK